MSWQQLDAISAMSCAMISPPKKFKSVIAAIVSALALYPCATYADTSAIGKVITSFTRNNRTTLVLETRVPLVSGASVYVGDGIRAIVDDKLSYSTTPSASSAPKNSDEKSSVSLPNPASEATVYYYGATIAGIQEIPKDALVHTEASTPASYLQIKMEEHYTFESKKDATVTARQGDRVMMNKGSLNEVADRDIYEVYGSSGQYKGLVEMRGVGDFQSSGVLYNRLEDIHREALNTEVGDKLVFAGQRKLFGLGIVAGAQSHDATLYTKKEVSGGGGLLWSLTFLDGWGAEILFGLYARNGKDDQILSNAPLNYADEELHHAAYFCAPMWVKKNFLYPGVVSPFVAAGFSVMTAENLHRITANGIQEISGDRTVTTPVPVYGVGIEFFSGRFFRPRIEARYFEGPRINAGNNSFLTSSVFYSAGFLSTW
jgi:hypothetical protein